METATINISMPASLKEEVDAAIHEEGYGNTSEFFRDLARNHLKARQERKLEAMILEGLNSPLSDWTKEDVEQMKKAVTDSILSKRRARK